MQVPLVDLQLQYNEIRDEVMNAFDDALSSMRLVLGPNVDAFEDEFSSFCDVNHTIGVGSGTDALQLLLHAHGIGPGDEVVTTSFTFIATIEAIMLLGATPVLADIEPDTFCIDPTEVATRITPRTRAVLPVHLYGHPADMDSIAEVIGDRDIALIEDAAQAHGALYKEKPAGGLADGGAFSFYLSKNLAAYGEAGAITIDDDEIDDTIRALRVHGSREKYVHRLIGYNSRIDELQAAVLRIKLARLHDWNEARRRHAARYNEQLGGLADLRTPIEKDWARSVYHVYTIRSPRRDEIAAALEGEGVGHAVHYRVPCHLQAALSDLGYPEGALPETESAANEVLSLPMYPELTNDQIDYVCEVVTKALK
ncbi:MAG: DegT/DnrJ/EryC1/StrS family aminotransferase [Armatimonadota bacterium]